MSLLQLQKVEKDFKGPFAIKSTTLNIQSGEFFSLLGPSGCGKTTLLKLTAGLLTPDKGDVVLDHKIITSQASEKRGFSMVFQEALLFPHMTAEENVAFGLKMKGIRKKQRLQKARDLLVSVGLDGFYRRYPSALSGGQRQRVSLARAIATEPSLLLMDEPFSALDPSLREDMRALVARMHQEHHVTILFVTHDRDEAFQLSDRIGVMEDGRILQIDRPKDLYEKPGEQNVARYLGAKNVFYGQCREGVFLSDDFQIQCPCDHNVSQSTGWVVIRPETLTIIPKTESKGEEPNVFKGIIRDWSFRQGFYHIKVQVGYKMLEVVQYADVHLEVLEGEPIHLSVDLNQLHFIPEKG
ncbi:ABC transporter ATP-binding protein [Tuberibacillus sp. Marseille-P3662]|uniref:ABC transporter ATP-binding protein n=1 Tax=Tuberibacillus sp. Marseille-P3662 TaxID=1965358 RepID=UPI000A1C8C4A|nr:ABC transporter ATP-binding protein [Tuberibacillus sp. Marseille-P3662]